MPDPQTGPPNPAAERARSGGWFRRHWKEVLAVAVAVVPVAAYFLLRKHPGNTLPTGAFLTGGGAAGNGSSAGASNPITSAVTQTAAPAPSPGAITEWHRQEHNVFISQAGDLIHQFYDPSQGHWIVDSGLPPIRALPPGAPVQVSSYGDQFHIYATDAAGAIRHLWYQDGFGWNQETLPAGEGTASPPVNLNTPAQVFAGL